MSSSRQSAEGFTHESVMEKLRINSYLTKEDRMYLYGLLEGREKKRKLDLNNEDHVPAPAAIAVKTADSTCQTEEKVLKIVTKRLKKKEAVAEKLDDKELEVCDDVSLVNYLKEQANESEELQDTERIKSCLDCSYLYRRKFLTVKGPSVLEVKERYPILFQREQILDEFVRTTAPNVVSSFYENLTKHRETVFDICRTSDPMYEAIEKERSKLEDLGGSTEEEKEYFYMVGALMLIPTLFDESILHILHFKTQIPVGTLPLIVTTFSEKNVLWKKEPEAYKVYAEQTLICDAPDLPTAFLLYIAVYFVFNMHYPANCSKTTSFAAKVLMGIKDDGEHSKIISKVSRLLNIRPHDKNHTDSNRNKNTETNKPPKTFRRIQKPLD